jgi:hypothetical protein
MASGIVFETHKLTKDKIQRNSFRRRTSHLRERELATGAEVGRVVILPQEATGDGANARHNGCTVASKPAM